MIYDEKDQMKKDRNLWKCRLPRLQNHCSNTIVIESQKGQGQSNIAFSSSISVADAIRAASKLKADLKFSEVEASSNDAALFPGHRQRSRGTTNHNETYLLRHLKCI
jgi:hypothetical protein